ncbi:hypothetical protein BC828DRAFT_232019 [Blastocladiella britannica]|nr:hypothetical protein BC828DRAFT_232019 [Blastocladiella britannica]
MTPAAPNRPGIPLHPPSSSSSMMQPPVAPFHRQSRASAPLVSSSHYSSAAAAAMRNWSTPAPASLRRLDDQSVGDAMEISPAPRRILTARSTGAKRRAAAAESPLTTFDAGEVDDDVAGAKNIDYGRQRYSTGATNGSAILPPPPPLLERSSRHSQPSTTAPLYGRGPLAPQRYWGGQQHARDASADSETGGVGGLTDGVVRLVFDDDHSEEGNGVDEEDDNDDALDVDSPLPQHHRQPRRRRLIPASAARNGYTTAAAAVGVGLGVAETPTPAARAVARPSSSSGPRSRPSSTRVVAGGRPS